jgi:Ser/Thr protein kinase RdoA (MazF antagonist)
MTMTATVPSPSPNLRNIFETFQVPTGYAFKSADPYGSGHINDTYRVRVVANDGDDSGKSLLYILQRINHEVFARPAEVMENVARVTRHIAEKVRARGGDPAREALSLLPAQDGRPYAVIHGNYWRVYNFISGATSYEIGDDSGGGHRNPVKEAAAAFARFQHDVADLPPPRLHETIPSFGDTAHRFRQLERALEADSRGRAAGCREEVEFCLRRRADASTLTDLLESGRIPERVAHYDTKISNVLVDDSTGEGLCVIDLDTVMPGLAIYDFGDAVRAATATAAEDETDLSKVGFSMEKFELLVDGYLSVANEFLTDLEIDHLAFASRMVSFTIGLRFLTDYLNGDFYFKTSRQNHNLDRARTQLKTVADMEVRFEEMKTVVKKHA